MKQFEQKCHPQKRSRTLLAIINITQQIKIHKLMRKILITVTIIATCTLAAQGEKQEQGYRHLESKIEALTNSNDQLKSDMEETSRELSRSQSQIDNLKQQNQSLQLKVDSLSATTGNLASEQKSNNADLNGKISETNKNLVSSQDAINKRTLWGAVIAVLVILSLFAVVWIILKRVKSGKLSMENTIDNVRKTQEKMQSAQEKLQEDSIKLDNELLQIADKQLSVASAKGNAQAEPDHSLIIKLAQEIARIETNLSKMDKSVRGYKQLVQAKDRMINNVKAYGYEIISLIGQDYNDGMQFQTRFVPDESLPEGKRVITGMIKMQVNYNGKMIQPAEIVVSQNI